MGALRVVAGLSIAAGSVAGAALLRRRSEQRRQRVDLYFGDGSMISFAEGSPEADRLVPLAQGVLSAARA